MRRMRLMNEAYYLFRRNPCKIIIIIIINMLPD